MTVRLDVRTKGTRAEFAWRSAFVRVVKTREMRIATASRVLFFALGATINNHKSMRFGWFCWGNGIESRLSEKALVWLNYQPKMDF